MSQELWAIIGVGNSIATLIVGLGAFMVTAHAGINSRLDAMQTELHVMQMEMGAMQTELSDIAQRIAYIEGRLDVDETREE